MPPAIVAGEGARVDQACRAALDAQELPVDDAVGQLAAGRGHDVAEGLARDLHPPSGLFLVKALQVGQARRFQLVQAQGHLRQRPARHHGRLEGAHPPADPPALRRALKFTIPVVVIIL